MAGELANLSEEQIDEMTVKPAKWAPEQIVPRGPWLLIERRIIDQTLELIAKPESSEGSVAYYVHGVGTEVEDVDIGDRVVLADFEPGRPMRILGITGAEDRMGLVQEKHVVAVLREEIH